MDGGAGTTQPLSSGSTTFSVSGLTAGSHSLSASYAGLPAPPPGFAASSGTATLTVNQATPTVVASDPGGVFTGSAYPASATVNGVASLEGVGLTFTYYVGTGTGGTNLGATAPSGAGTYTVVASFAGSKDFTAASGSASFTISKASPAVVVTDASGTYTGSAYPATATVNGGATLEGVGLTLTYYAGTGIGGTNLGSTAPSAVGTYTVVASFAGSADYAPASASTTFNIAPAVPTVFVTDAGGNYNGSPFPATATVNGGASLEGVTPTLTYFVGTGTGGVNLGATAPSDAGIYTALALFPGSIDYTPASAQVTFTIYSPTSITITAPPIQFPASATVTVVVTADSGGPPTGDVTLSVDGGDDLTASLTDGAAAFDVSGLRPGRRCLCAAYAGTGLFLASTAKGTQVVYPSAGAPWCHCEGKLKVKMHEFDGPYYEQDFEYEARCEELPAKLYQPKATLEDIEWTWSMPRSEIKVNGSVASKGDYRFVRVDDTDRSPSY